MLATRPSRCPPPQTPNHRLRIVACLLKKGTLYVANVGDSRAIIGETRGGKLIAYPLSSDQTPFRKDERCAIGE